MLLAAQSSREGRVDSGSPVRNKARVLPRGHALSRPPVARKQKFVTFLPGQLQIGINGFAGVVGQFEPDGTSSLFLTHRRTGDRMPIGSNVFDLERNDIASPQLAIDRRLNSANSRIRPSMWSLVRIDQTCLGQSGGLAPMSFPLFQDVRFGAD